MSVCFCGGMEIAMKWNRYQLTTTTASCDLVVSMLSDCGIEGVEIEDHVPLTEQDTAKMFIDILPELPEDKGICRISFYLDAESDTDTVIRRVREGLEELRDFTDIGSGQIEVTQTEDEDWANNWKEFFHSFYVDDIFIHPTWEKEEPDRPVRTVISIDPGISFGTGQHETTQLCIRALAHSLKKGDRVLDLGCGSGILSIVSLKLGASHVTGTDIDVDCITSSKENLAVNGLTDSDHRFLVGNLITDQTLQKQVMTEEYDIVVANILADVIVPMAPFVPGCLKEGGTFICSGIIDFKEQEVVDAVRNAGLAVTDVSHQGEWVSVTAVKM